MKEFLYFDKNIDNPDNLNRTLMFGEGVFETFRYKIKIFFFCTQATCRGKYLDKLQWHQEIFLLKY